MQLKTKFIALNAVTNAIAAQMPSLTLKGNNTGATANQLDLTVAQVNVLLRTAQSTLDWYENATTSPTPISEYGISLYGFNPLLGQGLTAVVHVPQIYVVGSPIKIYNRVYSASTSGTLLFQTVSTLIRVGTDLITSTTNKRTSTNAAITMSAGNANIPQSVVYDITDATGKVNNVAVNPGDLILITLTRSTTDTSTGVARNLVIPSLLTFA